MSHLALCYPKLSADDRRFIDDFRARHDLAYRDVVKPHFTMVFQIHDLPRNVFCEHVARIAATVESFSFVCRYAMVHDDDSSDDYYVFLVPDEGFSQFSRLHDALYTGPLAPNLRLDNPYVPHIGIATMKEAQGCNDLADDLNHLGLSISGKVEEITVVEYNGKVVVDLEGYRLLDLP